MSPKLLLVVIVVVMLGMTGRADRERLRELIRERKCQRLFQCDGNVVFSNTASDAYCTRWDDGSFQTMT